MITVTYDLPSYLTGALINNDWDGLTEKEAANLVEWLERKVLEHGGKFYCLDCEETGFSKYSDYWFYDNTSGNLHQFTFHVNK